jgi:hypothetical protein
MVEVLKSFESVAGWLHPLVLVVPGLAMVGLGLLAWLAGLWARRVVLALAGAAAGLLVGFGLGVRDPRVLALAVAGGVALGAIVPRVAVAILLAALSVTVAFGIVARGHPIVSQGTLINPEGLDPAAGRFSVSESVDLARVYALDLTDRAAAVGRQFAPGQWAVIASVGSGMLTLGLLFGRLADAFTFSALGAVLVFAGLAALLMFKGSAPVAHMEPQGALYGLVLLGMAVFGTVEQLCLCRPPKQEPNGKGPKPRAKQKEAKGGWRNR